MKYIIVLSLALIGVMVSMSVYSRRVPDTIGMKDHRLQMCPQSTNCVLESIPIQGSEHEVSRRLQDVIEEMGGDIVEAQKGYLRAEFSSSFFRFIDDLECLYIEDDGRVHIRSASRVGHYDFNANRKRIEKLRARVAQ